MPGQGRKRAGDDVAPVIEGEIVPATLEDLDEPAGREGDDELDGDAVEMSEADEEDEEDEEDEDEDEDEGTVIEAQLRHIWHLVADGATESIEKHLPLHLQT